MTRPDLNPEREEIARIIDPRPFKSWQMMHDYGRAHGDDEEEAVRGADYFHKAAMDEALSKADAILALLTLVEGELSSSVAESGGTASPKSDSDGGH